MIEMSNMNDSRILVTGGAGFIGSEVVKQLIKICKKYNKLSKGVWRMPRHMEAMKDVVSCDKLRVGANNLKSGDFRMGQPSPGYAGLLPPEYIGWVEPTGRTDTSKYPQEEKILMISSVAASEQERA